MNVARTQSLHTTGEVSDTIRHDKLPAFKCPGIIGSKLGHQFV